MKHPERGEIWVKRKTGERFEVWSVHDRWVIVYPERSGKQASRPRHHPQLPAGIRTRRRTGRLAQTPVCATATMQGGTGPRLSVSDSRPSRPFTLGLMA
jgi:hypothetical protein